MPQQIRFFFFFVNLAHVLYSCPLNYAMTLCINCFYAHDSSQFCFKWKKSASIKQAYVSSVQMLDMYEF